MHAGAAATLTHTGSIVAVGLWSILVAGGTITNSTTTARISGGTNGVLVTVGAAIITNAGTIAATNGSGVLISVGGTVTNSGAAAHITGLSTASRRHSAPSPSSTREPFPEAAAPACSC